MNRGAANPLVTQGDLGKLPIVTPARPLQIEIGATLKQLDDRITLLLETNATLEAIAQALFKSWFVDFDPVRAKMAGHAPEGMDEATAALFPDALEEMELGLVPRGWQQCCVDDVASLKGGKQLEKEHFKIEGRYPVFGGAGVMGRSDSFNAEGFVITVGRVGAYCGQYFWTQGKAWVNNNASLVSAKTAAHSVWLLHWLKSVDMDVIKKGAAQPFVSNGDIASLKMVLPPNDLIGQFVEVCASIYIRLSGLSSQAQTLTDLRDSALCRFVWKAPVPAASE
jgi:restriction endonuclease S subunit